MNQIREVLYTMCRRVGTPLAKEVSGLLELGDWRGLQKLRVDPCQYNDPYDYWRDAMCVDLLRKCKMPSGIDTKRAAAELFLGSEQQNAVTNSMISRLRTNTGLARSDVDFDGFLDRWKVKIRDVMGRIPGSLTPRFSTGATTGTTGLATTILDKLSTTPDYYGHGGDIALHCFYQCGWSKVSFERSLFPVTTRGNHFFTVPKDGEKDRGCAKEAVINVSLQLAVGQLLRDRLKEKRLVDLLVAAPLHRELARQGSLFGHIATLDMSSASDLWARELVRYVLPEEWRMLLNSLRATHTRLGDKWVYLEKFSSMGNGFTFELETILFYTLALQVCEDEGYPVTPGVNISCFGDDLIVPSAVASAVVSRLKRVGHTPNPRKTFLEGHFRESCGGDYHSGVAVSTVKLEKVPKEPQQWISLANNLRRTALQFKGGWALIKPAWDLCLAQIPRHIRSCRGPEHLGDSVIHDDRRFWCLKRSDKRFVRAYVAVGAKNPLSAYDGFAAKMAYSALALQVSQGVPLRKVEGYRLTWMFSEPWSDWLPKG